MPYFVQQDFQSQEMPASAAYRSVARDKAITPSYPNLLSGSFWRSVFLGTGAQFAELREQLIRGSNLCPDWDSYGADPPNELAVLLADRVLTELEAISFPQTRIVPSAEGGIGLCFVEGDKYADIECLNTGDILAAAYRGQQEPRVWQISDESESIKAAIEDIRVHIAS